MSKMPYLAMLKNFCDPPRNVMASLWPPKMEPTSNKKIFWRVLDQQNIWKRQNPQT